MENDKKEFNWYQPDRPKITEPTKNMIALVNLPVKVFFEWQAKIAADWDEDGNVLDYVSGYVMKVLPNQGVVFNKHEFMPLGFCVEEPK